MPGLGRRDTLAIVYFIISVYQVIPSLEVVVVVGRRRMANRGDIATRSVFGRKI